MAQSMRFGRRLALPSTRQIRHELIVLLAEEARLLEGKADAPKRPVTVPGVPS